MTIVSTNVQLNSNNQINFGQLDDVLSSLNVSNPNVGQIRLAQVIAADPVNNYVQIYVISDKKNTTVSYPGFMVSSDGFSGMWYGLKKGDLVYCGIGPGNIYYITDKIGNPNNDQQNLTLADNNSVSGIYEQSSGMQDLKPGSFLLKSGTVKVQLDENDSLFLGDIGYGFMHFDLESNLKYNNATSLVSNQFYNFTTGSSNISGLILRDKRETINSDDYNDPTLYLQWYSNLSNVNFDPSLIIAEQTKAELKRNPPLLENREIIYEFPEDYNIESDTKESVKQNANTSVSKKNPLTSRRVRKEDTLSLSLVSPNYLYEKIIGTVADINGKIVDLNRNVLPIGTQDGLASLDGTSESYFKVRNLHRKGLSFHWEQNSRKDNTNLNIENGEGDNYATNNDATLKRNRSKFFFDLDKEGQFKLNIPASSEIGNVGLLSRYDNYTTINPTKIDNNTDYDYFKKNIESNDVLLDQYGYGVVELKGNDKLLPKDRITKSPIKLGTAFHDISKTCVYPIEPNDTIEQYRSGILFGPDNVITDGNKTTRPILKNTKNSIVSTELNIDGYKANAGGRSGTIVFDGMINCSIGANTADRQSAWFDYQGGIVERIGSDKNGISKATQTDGDVYYQIGGDPGFRLTDGSIIDKDPDPRFTNDTTIVKPSSNKTNRFELRVIQGNGQYCRILIDNDGIIVSSPKNIEFRTDEDLLFYAGGNVRINGEAIYFHKDEAQNISTPIHRQVRNYDKVYEKDASGDGYALLKPYLGSQTVLG